MLVVAEYSFSHKKNLVFWAQTLSFFGYDDGFTANSTVR